MEDKLLEIFKDFEISSESVDLKSYGSGCTCTVCTDSWSGSDDWEREDSGDPCCDSIQ